MTTHQKTYELSVQPRAVLGKHSKKLRRESILPAVLYGYGVEPTPVMVDQKEMERVYMHAGSISLIDLKVGDGDKPRKVFIHNVQRNPVSHGLIHVDFMAVNLTEAINATVPLVLVGEAPAVAQREGMLTQALDHVQVRALPTDLPQMVEVDISGLAAVDDAIHVSDLTIASNVQLLTNEDEMIVKVSALPIEVEEVAEEEAPEGEEEEGEEAEASSSPAEGSEGESEG